MTPLEIRKYFASHALTTDEVEEFVNGLSDSDWETYQKGNPFVAGQNRMQSRKEFLDQWKMIMGVK